MKLIKKYKNRRLYDTEISQYITIEDLHAYVIHNKNFRVEEAHTLKDITSTVLLQLLVEMEGEMNPLLSVNILKQLIIAANHPMHQSFKQGLEQLFTFWKQFK